VSCSCVYGQMQWMIPSRFANRFFDNLDVKESRQ
jgi:hypothetical protein